MASCVQLSLSSALADIQFSSNARQKQTFQLIKLIFGDLRMYFMEGERSINVKGSVFRKFPSK